MNRELIKEITRGQARAIQRVNSRDVTQTLATARIITTLIMKYNFLHKLKLSLKNLTEKRLSNGNFMKKKSRNLACHDIPKQCIFYLKI